MNKKGISGDNIKLGILFVIITVLFIFLVRGGDYKNITSLLLILGSIFFGFIMGKKKKKEISKPLLPGQIITEPKQDKIPEEFKQEEQRFKRQFNKNKFKEEKMEETQEEIQEKKDEEQKTDEEKETDEAKKPEGEETTETTEEAPASEDTQ